MSSLKPVLSVKSFCFEQQCCHESEIVWYQGGASYFCSEMIDSSVYLTGKTSLKVFTSFSVSDDKTVCRVQKWFSADIPQWALLSISVKEIHLAYCCRIKYRLRLWRVFQGFCGTHTHNSHQSDPVAGSDPAACWHWFRFRSESAL